jgi:hypothetical protein
MVELIIFYISLVLIFLYLCITKIYDYNYKDVKDTNNELIKITINNNNEKNENQ